MFKGDVTDDTVDEPGANTQEVTSEKESDQPKAGNSKEKMIPSIPNLLIV